MPEELTIWKFAAERLKRNENLMLLVVAESSGSSPGRQGFKMIIAADEMRGSIGGGVMEIKLAETAKFRIQDSKFRIQDFKEETQNLAGMIEQEHRKNSPDASGMICSGKQTVIFFRLTLEHLEIVEQIIRALKKQQPRRLRITNYELRITNYGLGEADFEFERTGDREFIYEEKLGHKNRLFIIGGGHCALALSEIMSKMDFHISLFDDRADLNTLAKNRFVHKKTIIESYEKIDQYIASGANHFVVVMTLGYKFDEIVIRRLFDKNFKYFGVLGSRAKMKTLLKTLEKENFDRERLKNIHTPIGLSINSRTPEEIAVSIAAEIIAVKNRRD